MESGAGLEGTLTAAADFAEILREVGESLRDLEAVAARAPGMPAEPAGTRSPDTAEAGIEGGPPDDQEGRLLEILGRMGPSAEDRRTAARIMKRLLRSRGASGPREPES